MQLKLTEIVQIRTYLENGDGIVITQTPKMRA